MKIPGGCATRFEFQRQAPKLISNNMNDTIFNLESSGDF